MTIEKNDDNSTESNNSTETPPQSTLNKRNSDSNSDDSNDLASKPILGIAKVIVNRTCTLCCSVFILLVIMIVVDSMFFEVAQPDTRLWWVETHKLVKRYDALEQAQENAFKHEHDVQIGVQSEEVDEMLHVWMYVSKDYNGDLDETNSKNTEYWILTPENIERIIKHEDLMFNYDNKEWTKKYCLENDTTVEYDCSRAVSSLARDIAEHFNYEYNNFTTEDVKEYVTPLFSSLFYRSMFNEFAYETNQTWKYRSFYYGGLPYPTKIFNNSNGILIKESKYENDDDRVEKQYDEGFDRWAFNLLRDFTDDMSGPKEDNGLEIYLYNFRSYQSSFLFFFSASQAWAAASIIAVMLYLSFHLESIVLGVFSMFSIVMSFPSAYFIYRMVFQINYYDNLSVLLIFVVLGIGADDIFVFTDAWRQSVNYVSNPSDDLERMSFTFRRASKAMLITQATTFTAFLATATSPLVPMTAFAIWSALVIAAVYLITISLFTTLMYLWEKYIKKYERKLCCCCKGCFRSCRQDDENGTKQPQYTSPVKSVTHGGSEIELEKPLEVVDHNSALTPKDVRNIDKLSNEYINNSDYRWLERFFGGIWSDFVFKYSTYILILFIFIFGGAIYLATTIKKQDEQEKYFASDHYLEKIINVLGSYSKNEEDGLLFIWLTWGIAGINRANTDYWDVTELGKVNYDKNFNPTTLDSQLYLYNICSTVRVSDLSYSYDSMDCFTDDFIPYLNNVQNETFPYDSGSDDRDIQYQKYGEILYNFSRSTHGKYYTEKGQLHVTKSTDVKDIENNNIYDIKFIAFNLYSAVDGGTEWESRPETKKEKQRWNKWEKNVNENLCKKDKINGDVCNVKHSSVFWNAFTMQKAFINGALQGIGVALPLVYFVLLVATSNYIVSLFAVINVMGIILCEMAIVALLDWKFGLSESLSIVIIIGFSIDYVVHLAHAYLDSTYNTREKRLKYSLLTMGISVISGAITTFLSGMFLVFPPLIFLYKMGIFIMTTILWSTFFAFTFFSALLAKFGPQYKQGHIPIKKYFNKIKNVFKNDNEKELAAV